MRFAAREDAGRRLGEHLRHETIAAERVFGLPRGGVVVAAEVAHVLRVPLEVLIVRKIGHPTCREFAVGALAEDGVEVLDERVIQRSPLVQSELDQVINEERERLREYQTRFQSQTRRDLSGQSVLLVDDGLATGATMEAAVRLARKQNARKITVAVPVASIRGLSRLEQHADDVVALLVDPEFEAVGAYYDVFSQTTDEEVLGLLQAERHGR
jgi:putative phosphoribosyl transferase